MMHFERWSRLQREPKRASVRDRKMNPTAPSIFDLRPSEKLQLVEDLWDDLAATPQAVPVHDWQKQQLARRRANL
jgi:hypothetical protein